MTKPNPKIVDGSTEAVEELVLADPSTIIVEHNDDDPNSPTYVGTDEA